MFFVRIFLILLILLFCLIILNEEVESWCNDSYSACKSKFEKIAHNLNDTSYNVPAEAQRPNMPMKEYYEKHDQITTELMMNTRLAFREQYHVGSVMKDGFNADLPENAMWKNGVIVLGEDVRQQRQKEAAKTGK